MSKILFISNISNKINSFVTASIAAAHDLEMDFYHASNWQNATKEQITADEAEYDIKINNVHISRNPFDISNFKAYKQLVDLIKREKIDYIHCNTPVGGILGRLAGKKCKVKKVIYQVHGFHFYKGSAKLNWLLYYPVEKWLARYTDVVITINQEDYKLAENKLKLRKGGKVYYVPGVGINTKDYFPSLEIRNSKRAELGLSDDDFAVISAGRIEKNKNNECLIKALSKLKQKNIKLLLCGEGPDRAFLEALAKELDNQKQVVFLGRRSDMREIYSAADALAMASLREGLSRTVMEAMASGLPCIVSKIRGNVDLVEDGVGGFLCSPTDPDAFAKAIENIFKDRVLRENMKTSNLTKVKGFDISVVEKEIEKIYSEVLG